MRACRRAGRQRRGDRAGRRSDQTVYHFRALGNGGVRDAAGDLDRDGRADLAAVGADGKAVWFRATASGIEATPRPIG
ncbi:hypothetical protein K7B06_33025 [Streptomyces erythrochromogenes]|nr:hypothetical protein [Streptomyces erythrochromogenes]